MLIPQYWKRISSKKHDSQMEGDGPTSARGSLAKTFTQTPNLDNPVRKAFPKEFQGKNVREHICTDVATLRKGDPAKVVYEDLSFGRLLI